MKLTKQSVAFLLFAALPCAIFPISGRAASSFLWPKLFVLVGICLFHLVCARPTRNEWRSGLVSWGPWLISLSVTGIFSFRFDWALLGTNPQGMGILFWLLMMLFAVTTKAALADHPNMFRSELIGIQVGASANAAIAIVQSISGHRISGFFGHRAYLAGFLLLSLAVLVQQRHYFRGQIVKFQACIHVLAILLCQNRAALLGAALILVLWIGIKKSIPFILAISIALASFTYQRQVAIHPSLSEASPAHLFLRNITSDRTWMYRRGIKYFLDSPKSILLGDGPYAIHINHAERRCQKADALVLGRQTFRCIIDGKLDTTPPEKYQKHSYNIVIDRLAESGLIGFLTYSWLLGCRRWDKSATLNTVPLAYLVWCLFWFEAAYYTWLLWWYLAWSKSRANQLHRRKWRINEGVCQFRRPQSIEF